MPRYVLAYTRPSRNKKVGDVVVYDKRGKIGIFHKRYPMDLKPGELVIARVIAERENFYLLKPLRRIENGKIPIKFEPIEVWGRSAWKKLRMMRKR